MRSAECDVANDIEMLGFDPKFREFGPGRAGRKCVFVMAYEQCLGQWI